MMDEDGEELFDTHALSFDSTLESLLEVDFLMDNKESSYNPPTETAMSAPVDHGADLNSGEGGVNNSSNVVASNKHIEGIVETQTESPVNNIEENECPESVEDIDNVKKEMCIINETQQATEKYEVNVENMNTSNDPSIAKIVNENTKDMQETVEEETEKNETTNELELADTEAKSGTIESLNLDELKAKRLRKIAGEKTIKAVESNVDTSSQIINMSGIKANIMQNKQRSTQGDTLNTNNSGKRKLNEMENENENMLVPNKLCKLEDTDEQKMLQVNHKIADGESQDLSRNENKVDSVVEDINISTDKTSLDTVKNADSQSGVEDTIDSDGSLAHNGISSDNIWTTESADDTLTEKIAEEEEDEDMYDIIDVAQSENDDKVIQTNEGLSDKDQDNNDANSGDDSSDNDLDENDIDAMLDEGLDKKEVEEKTEKTEQDLKPGEFISREKLLLEEKGTSVFEMLPPGWIQVSHLSGMLVYLHKESRVCTMSKPYCLGQLSVRKHDIPLSAIPCLQYLRALEKEKKQEETAKDNMEAENQDQLNTGDQVTNGEPAESSQNKPPIIPQAMPVLESADKTKLLEAKELHEYCKGLFKFKTVIVKKFRTWKEKRIHLLEERRKRPGLPSNTQLITCALPENPTNKSKKRKKNFVLNPVGKTPVCILHEYTQHVLKVQPTYEFKEIENAETPYKATVLIDGIQYGFGVASGKRQAKAKAAQATLEVFMPQLAEQWKDKTTSGKQDQNTDLAYFEDVAIEDPRVTDLSDKAALPKPYEVLVECLRRNFGLGDTNLAIDKKVITNQKTEFSLSVGKHTAKVVCRNKREGKQRAAQAMLQILHPNLTSWASILRLYSKSTEQGFKEREEERAAMVTQYSKEKNFEILDQLKEAMRKARAQREEKTSSNIKSNIQSTTQPLDL